jgi:basic membrane protein A and related proteins
MQITKSLALGAATVVLIAACSGGGGATTKPSTAASAAAPSAAAPSAAAASAAAPSTAASPAATPEAACTTGTGKALPAPKDLKIGVVTDIGTLNDKNFNEYTYKGAVDAATALGAATPKALTPTGASQYASLIQQLVDDGTNIIVTVGFNLASATVEAACANPDIWFVGEDQGPICVDPSGHSDSTFACKGDTKTLLPHLTSVDFQEDQAGYLAGMVAATISKSGKIGAIGGTSACAPCIRYIQGYELGAKSINPNVQVNSKYVVSDFSNTAFHDPAAGNTFAQQFLAQFPGTDVMFQVAGDTGNGVLQAACTAGIYGIGVDVDQWLSLNADSNAAYQCLVTSAEKHVQSAMSAQVQAIVNGTVKPGDNLYNAAVDGVGVSPEHDNKGLITPDLQTKLTAALAAMKATPPLTTCPSNCGNLAPAASPAPGGSPAASTTP